MTRTLEMRAPQGGRLSGGGSGVADRGGGRTTFVAMVFARYLEGGAKNSIQGG